MNSGERQAGRTSGPAEYELAGNYAGFRARVLATLGKLGLLDGFVNGLQRIRYLSNLELVRGNARARRGGLPDGFPSPTPGMSNLVSNSYDVNAFYESGMVTAAALRSLLERHGAPMARLGRVLDFGCGCGRVLRHLHDLGDVELKGVEPNPVLVNWCRDALPFVDVTRIEPRAPLPFPDAYFDLIYSFSVFTHLPAAEQQTTMKRLVRVLKPGGLLVFSVHGEGFRDQLGPAARSRFDAGELIVFHERYAGKNVCGAYHPDSYVRDRLAIGLDLLDFVRTGEDGFNQDTYLLRRPVSGGDAR